MSQREPVETMRRLLDDRLRPSIVDASGPTTCHLVGGAIRDQLALGETAHDWDLIVQEHGEAVAERLAGRLEGRLVRMGGERFAAYRVVLGARIVDIWDRQGEPMERELARRDLTINSIALDLGTGEILDPMGGRADLDERILRANAEERFVEDPLRTLRLLRFSQQLPRFRIEPETLRWARSGTALIETVAAERVREELDRVLDRPLGANLADDLQALDLFPRLWAPDIADTRLRASLNILAEADRRLQRLIEPNGQPVRPKQLAALHHALLIMAASPATADLPHAPRSRERLQSLVTRRLLARATTELVETLLDPLPLPRSRGDRRLFIHRYGTAWPIVSIVASLLSAADDQAPTALEALADTAHREGPSILGMEPLLNGHDLERDFAIEPGPRMGALLGSLLQAQVAGSVRTEGAARKWVADQLTRSEPEDLDS